MINRKFGVAALLLAMVGLVLGCGAKDESTTPETGDTSTTPEYVFIADASNPDDLARLATILDIPMEDLGEIQVHRGANDDLAQVYWPQKNVTIDGLQSFRIDVSDEYDGDGRLEFRKGSKVLYSEPFDPDNTVTVGAIPQSVLDVLKQGSSVKWGIFFEGKDKKDSVYGSFKVVSGDKASRRIKKLEGSKNFLRQSPQTRELMKTQVLQNYKLYSEALVQYLGILNAWPEITSPYKGIVETCRRMDLDDTPLFALASDHVRGGGKLGRATANSTNRANRGANNPGSSVDVGNLPKSIETTAPPLLQRTSDGPKPFGSGHGVTPPDQEFPTETPEGTEEPAVMVDPAVLVEQVAVLLNGLETQADEAEAYAEALGMQLEHVQNLKSDLENSESAVAASQQNLSDKTDALIAAQNALAGDPENPALQQALAEAQVEADGAAADHDTAVENYDNALQNYNEATTGPDGHPQDVLELMKETADHDAADARRKADEAAQIQRDLGIGVDGQPVPPLLVEEIQKAEQEFQKTEAQNRFRDAEALVPQLIESKQAAEEAVEAAHTALAGDPTNADLLRELHDAELVLQDSNAALLTAEQELQSAQEALNALDVPPPLPHEAPISGG